MRRDRGGHSQRLVAEGTRWAEGQCPESAVICWKKRRGGRAAERTALSQSRGPRPQTTAAQGRSSRRQSDRCILKKAPSSKRKAAHSGAPGSAQTAQPIMTAGLAPATRVPRFVSKKQTVRGSVSLRLTPEVVPEQIVDTIREQDRMLFPIPRAQQSTNRHEQWPEYQGAPIRDQHQGMSCATRNVTIFGHTQRSGCA